VRPEASRTAEEEGPTVCKRQRRKVDQPKRKSEEEPA
jgi:hypothetical protein